MQKAGIKYVENTRSADDKSSVWHYFWKASDKNTANCKSCHQILKRREVQLPACVTIYVRRLKTYERRW